MSQVLKRTPFSPKEEAELHDTIGEFYDDPLGYVMYAFEWGKGDLEEFDGPDTWQREFFEDIGRRLRKDPDANIREAVASGHGIGKFLIDSSDLHYSDGSKGSIGAAKVGDCIMGGDGRSCTVTGVYPQGVKPLYRVTFSDGASVLAGAEHLWAVTERRGRSRGEPFRVLSTEQIKERGIRRRWQIPMCGAVQWPARDLPLHPYVMGYCIANGAFKAGSRTVSFSSTDADVVQRIGSLLPKGFHANGSSGAYAISTNSGPCSTPGANTVFTAIESMGLAGVHSQDKFIPEEYLRSCVADRLALLQGLMDADGCCGTRKGRAGRRSLYSTSSARLRDQIVELVQSLGGVASFCTDDRRGRVIFDGKGATQFVNYQLSINMPLEFVPFFCARKREPYEEWLRSGRKRAPIRAIESIEYECDARCTCISVDNADCLYLTDDFIVTHNTAEVAMLILWAMSTRGPNFSGVVTANTMTQLNTKTWRELALWHKRAINSHWFKWSATKFWHIDHPETWYTSAEPNTEHNSEAFAGRHAHDKLIIFDEASGIPDKIWEVTNGAMTDARSIWCVFGNPTRNTGVFRECFEVDKRWATRHIDSRTSRFTDKKELEEQIAANGGEDSDYTRVRIRGLFPRRGSEQFISSEMVDHAMVRDVPFEAYCYLPVVIGVDIARYGDDKSVICIRQGRKVHEFRKYRGIDTMEMAVKVVLAIKEFKAAITFVDGVGVGAGVVDRLRMLGYDVVEVNAGEVARDETVYSNKRTEMWNEMRDWLRGGSVPADSEVRAALIGVEYFYDDRERVRLERKKDTKSRAGESPDEGDALAHTFAEPLGDLSKGSFEPDDSFEPDAAA